MGKTAKDHRKKVAARNAGIKAQQKKYQKFQNKFLTELIEREKAAGKFDSAPITSQDGQLIDAPSPILTEQQGPIL